MNIRSISNPTVASELRSVDGNKQVKMGESHQDRDADGRRQHEEPDQSPLTEEEMKKAKEYLESLDGLKNNGLSFAVEVAGSIRVIVIKDSTGHVVRRIPEHEMRLLADMSSTSHGRIFDRAG